MGRWYRIFGSLDAAPALAVAPPLALECFSADEEGVRAELNSWAAFLETCDGPNAVPLMERAIQTRFLFTLHDPTGEFDRDCVALCRQLAHATAGFYQIDDVGFFDADGTLLVSEGRD
jgi:hypothetical protein